MVIDSATTPAEVETLHALGVRGARFHMAQMTHHSSPFCLSSMLAGG